MPTFSEAKLPTRRARLMLLAGVVAATSLALLPAAGSGQRPGPQPQPPATAARVVLDIEGTSRLAFAELKGIEQHVEPTKFTSEGPADKPLGVKMPSTITLVRTATRDLTLAQWHGAAEVGVATSRRDATLVVYDAQGRPSARWRLANAWPSRLDVTPPTGAIAGQLDERVTLVAEQITRGE